MVLSVSIKAKQLGGWQIENQSEISLFRTSQKLQILKFKTPKI